MRDEVERRAARTSGTRRAVLVALVLLVVGGGGAGWWWIEHRSGTENAAPGRGTPAPVPVSVGGVPASPALTLSATPVISRLAACTCHGGGLLETGAT